MRIIIALPAALLILWQAAVALPPLEYRLTVPAAPLQAYNALTVDWQMRLWMTAAGTISEPRSGGIWRVTFTADRIAEGLYRETERGERLVYSQIIDDEATSVTVLFVRDAGRTRIDIRHEIAGEGRAARRIREQAEQWWLERLPELTEYLISSPGAYYAVPAGDALPHTVLVLHDRFGLNRTTRGVCDSLAAAGYYALAPDLFKGDVTGDAAQAARFLELVDVDDAVADARTGLQAVRELPRRFRTPRTTNDRVQNKTRTVVFGVGFGGTLAIRLAAADPQLKGSIVWQGAALPEYDLLRRIACPVLGVFGEFNSAVPRPEIAAFDQTLVQAGVRVRTVICAGPPNFADPAYGESFSASAVSEAWMHTIRFLDKQLRF